MKIESIRIHNYRVFQNVLVENIPNMAVFLGMNGVGKTTFFDVFGFLHDSLQSNVRAALAKRGGFQEVISRGQSGDIEFEIKFRPSEGEPLITYQLVICLAQDRKPAIKKEVMKLAPKKSVSINITEVKRPDTDAQLIAENIAAQLEKRTAFRRAMKGCISKAMKSGVKGIKTKVSGRLDGAEIARSESYHEGSIPLQTLRADIDYGTAEAHTTFGIIGVKVWVYKGEVLGKSVKETKEGGNA